MRKEPATEQSMIELLGDALLVQSWRVDLLLAGGRVLLVPVVKVDTTGRPDVADLARVHQTEGEGDTWCCWTYLLGANPGEGCALLEVRQRRPVRCRFKVVIRMAQRELLGAIVDAETVALDVGGPGPVWYGVPTRDLAAVLARGVAA